MCSDREFYNNILCSYTFTGLRISLEKAGGLFYFYTLYLYLKSKLTSRQIIKIKQFNSKATMETP